MIVESWLRRAARTRPDAVALRCADATLSYADLDEAADTAARRLSALGVRPGDRVALALPAQAAFAQALHGCMRLGAVAVALDLRLTVAERAVRSAGCVAVIDAPPHGDGDPHAPLLAEHDLDAPAIVVHTSGTTAEPRAIELTYGNWLWSALGSAVALGLDPEERWLCTLPLSHVGGLSILLRNTITATTVVPTTLARLLDAGLSHPPALRAALVGGGPIAPALLDRARAAGVPVVTTYGLTEACSQVATGAGALFCTRVRIAPGGEILVAGPTVAPRAAAPDGWLHTGDLGALGADGELRVTGRAADTIVTGGENVAPAEVEEVLASHPAVAEVAVHGVPDAQWGERIVATIVLAAGASATASDLEGYCRVRIARYKVPKVFRFSLELPRTGSGKLLRRDLEE
jgi:O-succinylbenzoic acid--CoA ligase